MYDYNLLDYDLDNKFDFDLQEDSKRKEYKLEKNHMKRLVLNNSLEYNIFRLYHFFFKYDIKSLIYSIFYPRSIINRVFISLNTKTI